MKVVVVGATGFIGSHVVRALMGERVDVRVLKRPTSSMKALEGLKVEEVTGSLDDPASLTQAFRGAHVLFHTAGYYPAYAFDKKGQRALALQQLENLLRAAAEAGCHKIIYTSSLSTIGKPKGRRKLANEETPYDPNAIRGIYYEIKYALEQKILEAAANGLKITIVNPTGVFGDFDVKPTSGRMVVMIAKRQVPAIVDRPINVIDARDVGQAQVAAMKLGKPGRRYILGGENTTTLKVARLIAQLAGVPPPRLKLPLSLVSAASWGSEIVGKMLHRPNPVLPRVGVDFLRHGQHFDTTRAQTELGLKTRPMEETFERALSWFRANNYI